MRILLTALSAAALAAAVPALAQPSTAPIDPAKLSEHTRILSGPEFHGRAPGGPGEQATVDYVVGQFKALGLKPAGDKGGWTQAVPLIRTQVGAGAKVTLNAGGQPQTLTQFKEVRLHALRPDPKVQVADAPLVWVGYGVAAPERGWDDFKGVDLKGKVAVILINDPDFEAKPGEPVAGKFGGQAATYYARWTYKYEEAFRQGAVGALIVHETAGAAYGWSTITASNGESYDVRRADPSKEKLAFEGWITRELAVDLFAKSGLDFEAEKARARTAGFTPVALKDAKISVDLDVTTETLESRNILAALPGKSRPGESVMYAAHWDGYGVGPADAQGNTIRPGALDDAIGVGGVIEIARAFAAGPRPERTIVFAAWTAEERGLLGSEYYASAPSYPLETTVANFTLDVLQPLGPSKDVVLVGAGQNELEQHLAYAAARQARVVTPDARPERALFYRADHFSLAKRGVPVLLLMALGGAPDLVEGGRAAGDRWVADYTARCYHQTCDAWSGDWNLTGAAQDVALVYEAGKSLATSRRWPQWNASSEFKALRDASAARRR
ncbi:M28 family metallopeptidase [Phenylobacterium sp. J367]|uniref:M28 family metallopeptidase n=1 Tax=Phenylobacterium sp. J367 TaxID=2898435 RepID=UPI002150C0E6|nr:M28 family metallopeptidase [Phenylobacterium sp. J367]MCR5878535.1 M28 family metallopeptidase [Phenylobacterium sp. J367]